MATNIPVDPVTGKTLWWCETRGGQHMCLPRFLEVAGWFKGLQRATNAWRAKNGKPPIRVDARIGPETREAVNEALAAIAQLGPHSTEDIAWAARSMTAEIAKAVGVNPDESPDPKPQPQEIPTAVPPETTEDAQKSGGGSWKWWLIGGVAVAAVGGLGYWLYKRNQQGQPLFAGSDDPEAPELGDGAEYEDEPPPPFRNVIDV